MKYLCLHYLLFSLSVEHSFHLARIFYSFLFACNFNSHSLYFKFLHCKLTLTFNCNLCKHVYFTSIYYPDRQAAIKNITKNVCPYIFQYNKQIYLFLSLHPPKIKEGMSYPLLWRRRRELILLVFLGYPCPVSTSSSQYLAKAANQPHQHHLSSHSPSSSLHHIHLVEKGNLLSSSHFTLYSIPKSIHREMNHITTEQSNRPSQSVTQTQKI